MFRRLVLIALISLTAFVGYKGWKIYQFNALPSLERAEILSSIPIEGKFSLIDHNAQAVSEATYFGRYTLVFFGYTYCPDVCPTMLSDVAVVMDDLGALSKQIVPIFITVDPERDTPDVLKDYVENFHPDVVGLSGSLDDVDRAARSFRAQYGKVTLDADTPEDYSMSHSADLFLMDPQGKPVKSYRFGVSIDALTKDLRAVLTGK